MRKSSRGLESAPGMPTDDAVKRASEMLGYEPTPGQILVKHSYWTAWRLDPQIDPKSVTPQDVLACVDAPSIDKWWRDAGFRDWFLNKEEWRGKAEAALHLWLDQTYRRLATGMLPGGELAQLGKLLVEVTGRSPKSALAEKNPARPMNELEARAQFEQLATQLGWTPPAQLGPKA